MGQLNSGPPPKHPDQRVRRNKAPGTIPLPAEGYGGPIPRFPLRDPIADELTRWNEVWRKPQAAMWAKMDIIEVVARYVRTAVLVETGVLNVAGAAMASEARQLEDRLGLSPMSLLRLRWEITEDEVGQQRQARAPRRLRAVDE